MGASIGSLKVGRGNPDSQGTFVEMEFSAKEVELLVNEEKPSISYWVKE